MYCTYADAFLTITNVNINFNNNACLLSNMTPEQLYKASVNSGLKNMSWAEFSGQTTSVSNHNYTNYNSDGGYGFTGVGAYAPIVGAETDLIRRTPGFQAIATVGSMVVLNLQR